MSERERWVVYPLLFLALGVALRDELMNRTWSRNVVCERLVLIDSDAGSPSNPNVVGIIGKRSADFKPGGALHLDHLDASTVQVDTLIANRIVYPGTRQIPNPSLSDIHKLMNQQAESADSQPAEAAAPAAPADGGTVTDDNSPPDR